jgi:hypothetical protein
MNRKQMIDFINDEILPQCKNNDYWFSFGREMMKDIIRKISNYRIGKNINMEMKADVIDGVLYINNDCLGRIEPKTPKKPFDEISYNIEGRILARQERFYD